MTAKEIIVKIEKLSPEERDEVAAGLHRFKSPPEKEPLDASDEAVWDVLLKFAGKAEGDLPEDLTVNHDHYLYGVPKQQP